MESRARTETKAAATVIRVAAAIAVDPERAARGWEGKVAEVTGVVGALDGGAVW